MSLRSLSTVLNRTLTSVLAVAAVCEFIILICPGAAHALPRTKSSPPPLAASPAGPAERTEQVNNPIEQTALSTEEIERSFYRGINQALAGQEALSTAEFIAVRDQLQLLGYLGSSAYSRQLIEAAVTRYDRDDSAAAASLFQSAILLSPDDPQILLAAASFPGAVGYGKSVDLLLAGSLALLNDPIASAKLLVNFVLTALAALTLSIGVALIIQIARNGDQMLVALGRRLPIRIRGLAAPLLLILLITLPLKTGIAAVVGSWALLTAFLLPGRRRLGVAAGLLIMAWGLSIEHLAAVSYNVSSPAGRLISNISTGRFQSGDDREIGKVLPSIPDPYLASLSAGLNALRLNELPRAETHFSAARADASAPSEKAAAMINLSTVFYSQKRFSEAKAVLEQAEQTGFKSFELYYNLANTSIALLDVEAHRRYLALAAAADHSRAYAAEQLDTDFRPAITILPPWISVFRTMFTPVRQSDQTRAVVVEAVRQTLLGTMFPLRRSWAVTAFGGLIFCLALLLKRRTEMPASLRSGSSEQPSRIWSAFPGGRGLAGERPILSVAVLALVIGLVLSYLGVPVHLFSLRAGELSSFHGFVWAAAAIWMISSAFSFVSWNEPVPGGARQ